MERKEFLKQAAGFGLCSCTVAALFAAVDSRATEEAKPEAAPAAPPEDWKPGFMRQRFADLLGEIEKQVAPEHLSSALGKVGAGCADASGIIGPFAGNPEGFIAEIRKRWGAEVNYDAAGGVVALSFPGTECACPLVRKGVTPVSMCQCSLGWQKHAWSVVFGKPVEPKLLGSILRGGEHCSFEIRVVRA